MDNRLITFAVTAAICLASCSNDEVMEQNSDPKGKAITFYAKVGHSTRADETKLPNLGDFYVFGKSVHPDGSLYSAYLVGSESDNTFTPETATKKGETWSLGREIYLPNGITNAVFWAFTDGQSGDDELLSNCAISFDHNTGPKITGYTSAKAGDISQTEDSKTIWADGSIQKDLISAFGQAKQSNGTLSNIINLNFNHMLSQVTIKAAQKGKDDNDHRVVKVKGVWLVNVKSKANLSAGYNKDSQTDATEWSAISEPTMFGTYYKDAIDLSGKTGVSDDDWENLSYSSLMLIPQTVEEWEPKFSDTETTTNAYIMLLCRVELKHAGATHEGKPVDDNDIFVKDGYHYHQQFPVITNNKFNPDEYGLTCIPLNINWEKGKHYTIKLQICGSASGAGIYPPNPDITNLIPDDDNITIVTTRPAGKLPGKAVLDEPIIFSVDVKPWGDGKTWTNGTNGTDTTGESSDNN